VFSRTGRIDDDSALIWQIPKAENGTHDCLPLSLLILAFEGTRRLLSLDIRSFLFGFGSENFEASNNLRIVIVRWPDAEGGECGHPRPCVSADDQRSALGSGSEAR
jgi:hypothetical protein